MSGKIFKSILILALYFIPVTVQADESYFIQFDTVVVTMKVSKCHFWSTMSQCVYFPEALLKQWKPKKIIKTNVPKFQKWQRYNGGWFFKVVKC